ncbi:transcriptional regulator NrdR family protein [Algisphaera agarilytica]|uniref:Transcriptional regulator NrdR family protein n=1 Tax=Algisphaera agarilytica TaxID=1385975 RepID=A0A7X0H8L2_9BACT|nr:transcriptional regulator NrdR family protein [Algisphaera agarilytica]
MSKIPAVTETAARCPKCGSIERKITHSRQLGGESRELRCECLTCTNEFGDPTRYVVIRR